MTSTDLEAAHRHSSKHREEILDSSWCGCFHCLATYRPDEIADWCDENDQTAVCPRCDIDAVFGDLSGFPVEQQFLEAMHERWFQPGGVPPDDLKIEDVMAEFEGASKLDRIRGWFGR
jgi:hypothetical protein